METDFAAPVGIGPGGNVDYGTDKNLIVEFFTEGIHMAFESERQGRPISKNVPFVRINIAGDRTRTVCREASELDQRRWPHQWAAYQREAIQVQDGTPLEQWPILTKADVLSFKHSNIHTVENLASIDDQAVTRLGPGVLNLRAKARLMLEHAKTGGVINQLDETVKKQAAQIAALENQLRNLRPLAKDEDEPKRKPGRPRKSIEPEAPAHLRSAIEET